MTGHYHEREIADSELLPEILRLEKEYSRLSKIRWPMLWEIHHLNGPYWGMSPRQKFTYLSEEVSEMEGHFSKNPQLLDVRVEPEQAKTPESSGPLVFAGAFLMFSFILLFCALMAIWISFLCQ